MKEFGHQLIELRKARDLSQHDVAVALGVSQATVSRIESGESFPTDVRQLTKLAKLLQMPLTELLTSHPEHFPAQSAADDEIFYAFCPNPLCESNQLSRKDGVDFVLWKSGGKYASNSFDEINFCDSCGTELVKDCKNCGRPLTRLARFCVKCGEPTYAEPSPDVWKQITAILNSREPIGAPPPSDEIPF